MAELIRASLDGASKTKLMYKCYLSYTQLKAYLGYMLSNKLLDEHEGVYKPTTKGRTFLNHYDEMNKFVGLQE